MKTSLDPTLSRKTTISEGLMPDLVSPCPWFPICVCSRQDASPLHRVEPIAADDPIAAFNRMKSFVARMPRTVIVTATDEYLHAVCRNRISFVDDLECRLCTEDGAIHVRSASRLALWDFGANRARVETIRRWLRSG